MSITIPVICPKCGYARTASDIAPGWQCPSCGIAYLKYQAWLAHTKKFVSPLGTDNPAPAWNMDGSVWFLLSANIFSLVIAWYQEWTTVSLMALYWAQSVIIGVAHVGRILSLHKYTTGTFTADGQRTDPETSDKWVAAFSFIAYYGFMHAMYLSFIIDFAKDGTLFDLWFWVCAAVFALNHLWSYFYNINLDRHGTPNLRKLLEIPLIRIMPMHITIIVANIFVNTIAGLMLFGALKTIVDVTMHLEEHEQMKGGSDN